MGLSPSSRDSIVPAVHEIRMLEDSGGSQDQNIDGSSVNVKFSKGPAAGQLWFVTNVAFAIQDTGPNSALDYGAISNGLTNGLLLQWNIDSTDFTLHNIKNNFMVAFHFIEAGVFQGRGSNFISDSNFFAGTLKIEPNIVLDGDKGDELKFTVRDNLTGVNFQRSSVHYWRAI